MSSIFAYVNLTLVACAATFVATLVFSQKIKDWFSGVPSELRTGLKGIEAKILADVKTYQADLIAKVAHPAVVTTPEPPKAA
jgi:hypothetical protein